MLNIAIVNGPNLNLIGTRETDIYGGEPLDKFLQQLQSDYKMLTIETFQSNIEGELINFIHSCRGRIQGIVLNGGAYTHTSIAIADALVAVSIPTVEVHISNIHAREEYRQHSYTAAKCIGCITGLGLKGYKLAVDFLQDHLSSKTS